MTYLVEDRYGDLEIVEEIINEYGVTILSELEMVASYDHGLRTADETAFVVGCEAAACVMAPILCAVWGQPLEYWRGTVDYAAALQNGPEIPYRGEGWADEEYDFAEDVGAWLYEWSDQMVDAAQSVGWVIETSADAGMTWFYRPI